MKHKILIVDDEPNITESLTMALEAEYDVKTACDASQCMEIVMSQELSLCILDLRIGKDDGLLLLQRIMEYDRRMAAVIITAYGDITSSVAAIKAGAFGYLTKPIDLNQLRQTIAHALESRRLNEQINYFEKQNRTDTDGISIIGSSVQMKKVYGFIDKVKASDAGVVILGESGTGKELVARAIHYAGPRKKEPFVVINCAAIPDGMLEEELFGHKRGAFTGAVADSIGKFEYAANGTVFLDEIGEMSMRLQAKLLRVLEQKCIIRIGSNKVIPINARVIAATNQNLRQMVDQGTFRLDLYFRLNVLSISMPPLREKRQDIPDLIGYYINRYNEATNRNIKGTTKEVEDILTAYDYPGNVRELSNIIRYAMTFCNQDYIGRGDLPSELLSTLSADQAELSQDGNNIVLAGKTLSEIERLAIEAALQRHEGNIRLAAQDLGISSRGLRNKVYQYRNQEDKTKA